MFRGEVCPTPKRAGASGRHELQRVEHAVLEVGLAHDGAREQVAAAAVVLPDGPLLVVRVELVALLGQGRGHDRRILVLRRVVAGRVVLG